MNLLLLFISFIVSKRLMFAIFTFLSLIPLKFGLVFYYIPVIALTKGTSNLIIVISSGKLLALIVLLFVQHLTFIAAFFYKYSTPLGFMDLQFCGAAFSLLIYLVLFLFVGFL